jgi:hypothetical protein
MRVDLKFGRNWGDAKHEWKEIDWTSPAAARPAAEPEPTTRKMNRAKVHPVEARAEIELPAAEKPFPPLAAIIGQPLKQGKIACPFHDDRTPSLHIYADHFHCFACGAHGNAVDWLTFVEGLERDAAFELLGKWQGPTSQLHKDEADTLASALGLWEQAQPIAGTPAEHYLAEARRIGIDKLPANSSQVLRFHPMCIFSPGTRLPCLLALFRDAETDAPAGIHRIALAPEVLAGGKVERRMLGRWPAARAIKLWPAESSLVIGEGIETVLAAASRVHRGALLRPAWALGSSQGIARFPLIAGVKQLTVLVDNDANGVGPSNAKECAKRWAAAGRAVALLTPQQSGADFNDLVRGSA